MTTLIGTKHSDLLYDGPEATTFVGRGGFDVFHFANLAVDTIKDFNVNKDTIVIDHYAFAPVDYFRDHRGDPWPVLYSQDPEPEFVYGGRHALRDPGVAYHKGSGKLWYDVDGARDHPAILIAKIGKGLDLTEDNIVIA